MQGRGGPHCTSTVVIVHADRGRGLLLARALAEMGVTVVMHSVAESQPIADLMSEIIDGGGHAAAIQSDLSDSNHPASLFPGMAQFVGAVTGVVLAPVAGEGVPARVSHRSILQRSELDPAAEAVRWARALATALPRGRVGTIIGVMPGAWRNDPSRAVSVGAWEGALGGLRRELASRGVRVHVVPLGEGGRSSRAQLDPVAAAHRVAALVTGRLDRGDDVEGAGSARVASDAGAPTGGPRRGQGSGRGVAPCR